MNFLLRAAQLARRPPSWKRVKLLLAIVAFALALYGIEQIWGWPEWLTVNGRPKLR